MTQQQNTRKIYPSLAREANVRPPVTHTKASGDSNEKRRNRSKSKNNKVPKSMRYDLENALVSLCDVWFEEIKPYLVRNNIKVHVHAASHCSHLDPGAAPDRHLRRSATSVGCCSTQPTASKAPCRRPRAPPPPLGTAPLTQSRWYNCKENPEPKSRRRRRHNTRKHASEAQRTAPPIFNLPPKNPSTKVQETRNKTRILDKNCFIQSVPKPKMKNKFTQTEQLPTAEPKMNRTPKSCLKGFNRRDGTTTLFPIQKEEKQNAQNKMPPLFPNDLIDIIAEKNDKRLQVLFRSPALSPYSSVMNLLPSPNDVRTTVPQKKPWR
ncbi:uncharacterized protein [Epargyreus clarus]|uniref:uncharacterized protein isoform X2 n=1 Tax=Epargyreus clarus TaxID=520877 RepID=UPI003C2C66A4